MSFYEYINGKLNKLICITNNSNKMYFAKLKPEKQNMFYET